MNFFARYNLFIFLGLLLMGVTGYLFFTKVDLQPKVTANFFFSSDSEIFKQDKRIHDKFPFQQQLLLNVKAPNGLDDPAHQRIIRELTNALQKTGGVDTVHSITNGPKDLKAAIENPLWSRLLIGNEQKSSFIVSYISTEDFKSLIGSVESYVANVETEAMEVSISGLPYIVEQIRRNISQDMKYFTAGAVILCAIVLLLVFKSPMILLGALLSCITAAMLTLVIQSFFGIPIGILTANLGAIVFVLTQTHTIFLSANWLNEDEKDRSSRLKTVIGHTLPASFWAGVTTLLGFASLIFVEAKPLNQLGVGGTIGTISAFVCAYAIFPAFLKFARMTASKSVVKWTTIKLPDIKAARKTTLGLLVIAIGFGVGGISMVNTDPSLLAYFKKGSDLHSGLYRVDENGGSNPLLMVVKRQDGGALDNEETYKKMWELQRDWAERDEVGSVISLPVMMAQGDEHWAGQLLPWNLLLDVLSLETFDRVARSFVNEERTEAMFILRMKENNVHTDRLTIINELQTVPPEYGLDISMTGGTYFLQGQLAAAVVESMIYGISALIILFGVVAFIVARSIKISVAVMVCAGMITLLVLGTIGLLGIPIDIISSPAINICLGLIVDDMIHLTKTTKRIAGKEKITNKHWDEALQMQKWPVTISTVTIMIGFSVFGLSDFPPSQRFGLEIVYGAGLAVVLALIVFPFLATRDKNFLRFFKKKAKKA